jgi:hypothetical protein
MAPIYAFASWMSLKFGHLAIHCFTVRNVHEGENRPGTNTLRVIMILS